MISTITPQQRLALLLSLFTGQLPRRRFTRLIMVDLLTETTPGTHKSTNDLSKETALSLLDRLFPTWNQVDIVPDDYPQLFELAIQANGWVDMVYPHPPQNPPGTARARKRAEYEAREAKRQEKQRNKREAKRQEKRHLEYLVHNDPIAPFFEEYQPINEDQEKLARLNAFRAKAGLPPIDRIES
jgi:hypothetical protein